MINFPKINNITSFSRRIREKDAKENATSAASSTSSEPLFVERRRGREDRRQKPNKGLDWVLESRHGRDRRRTKAEKLLKEIPQIDTVV